MLQLCSEMLAAMGAHFDTIIYQPPYNKSHTKLNEEGLLTPHFPIELPRQRLSSNPSRVQVHTRNACKPIQGQLNRALKRSRLTSHQVNKDPALVRHVRMDLKQSILCLIEPGHVVKLGRLDKLPAGIIAPAMIPTAEHRGSPGLFSCDGVCAMSADIVECADLVVFASDQEYREPGDVEGLVGASFGKLAAVGKVYPSL